MRNISKTERFETLFLGETYRTLAYKAVALELCPAHRVRNVRHWPPALGGDCFIRWH
jgi:hypothetical protein